MSKFGSIIIVEDDYDDKEVFESVVRELNIQNTIEWFSEAQSAYEYLSTTSTSVFIIFSDINMPGENGLEFKRRIDSHSELRKRCIPFIFYSTAAEKKDVDEAYLKLTIQGFFKKANTYQEAKKLLKNIFEYWSNCKHPHMDGAHLKTT